MRSKKQKKKKNHNFVSFFAMSFFFFGRFHITCNKTNGCTKRVINSIADVSFLPLYFIWFCCKCDEILINTRFCLLCRTEIKNWQMNERETKREERKAKIICNIRDAFIQMFSLFFLLSLSFSYFILSIHFILDIPMLLLVLLLLMLVLTLLHWCIYSVVVVFRKAKETEKKIIKLMQ